MLLSGCREAFINHIHQCRWLRMKSNFTRRMSHTIRPGREQREDSVSAFSVTVQLHHGSVKRPSPTLSPMLRQGVVGAGVQSLPLHEKYRGFENVQLQRHYSQSQAVKNLLEAYRTLDLKDVE